MQVEFGDLHKFLVSVGVALIAIAVIVPWLFLKEPFDLFQKEADLSTLTTIAREVIAERQELVYLSIRALPILSPTAAFLGFILLIWGVRRWSANQRTLDEKAQIELALSKQTLRDATADEIEEHRQIEAAEGVAQEAGLAAERIQPATVDARNVESRLIERLRAIYGEKYDVLTEQIVGGAFLDVVLQGKKFLTKDYLLEMKHIRRGFNYSWLREVALKLRYISILYANTKGRIPNTILCVTADPSVWKDRKYRGYLEKLDEEMPRRRGKHRVVYLTPSDIDSLSAKAFQTKIGVSA